MGVRGVSGLLIVGSTLLAAAPAVAQSRDEASRAEARKIGYAGVEAYQAGEFATARERLDTAYQLLQVPSLGLWSARALAKLGKLVEAEARYLEVIRLPTSVGDEAIQQQARQDAGNERAALARRIPSVVVRIDGAPTGEVAVTIDDAALVGSAVGENHLVNPGRHQVEGIRGATRARAEISVAEGEQKEVVLRFAPGPAGASASAVPEAAVDVRPGAVSGGDGTMRTVGWVALGAGAAGIVAGAVAALIVRSKKNHLDEVGCGGSGQTCPLSEDGNVDSYNSLRPVPAISLVAGALLAGAGAYLLLRTQAPSDTAGGATASAGRRRSWLANMRLAIVPGGTIVSGEF
jgi:hypothetical protein